MQLTDSLTEAKAAATRAWYLACRDRYPSALVPDWRPGVTESGEAVLTVQVIGQHAEPALRHFAADYPLQTQAGDQRPGFEYRPGRVVCVWRTGGVWIEMWHHDIPVVPAPTPAAMPTRRALFPSGRLPCPRRHPVTVIKEN